MSKPTRRARPSETTSKTPRNARPRNSQKATRRRRRPTRWSKSRLTRRTIPSRASTHRARRDPARAGLLAGALRRRSVRPEAQLQDQGGADALRLRAAGIVGRAIEYAALEQRRFHDVAQRTGSVA